MYLQPEGCRIEGDVVYDTVRLVGLAPYVSIIILIMWTHGCKAAVNLDSVLPDYQYMKHVLYRLT